VSEVRSAEQGAIAGQGIAPLGGGAPARRFARPDAAAGVSGLEQLLEHELRARFATVVRRRSGELEVEGGAAVRVEWAAGAAFLCIEAAESTPLRTRWVPIDISRLHHGSLLAVIEQATDYLREALPYRVR
jgi:hypothetical protein